MTLPALDPVSVPLPSVALIEASAGTGKTFAITTLYVRLVLEGLEVRRILVVTYTKAATAELRARVRERLRQALAAFDGAAADDALVALVAARRREVNGERDRKLLLQALRSFDEAAIFTIHGFCQRMLQDYAFESRVAFDARLLSDQDLLRDEVVRDFWARKVATAPRWFVELLVHEKIGFERLSRLARKVAEGPTLEVVPKRVAAAELDPVLATWRLAWRRAATLWRDQRETILARLEEPEVLHKVPYGRSRERFAPVLDVELGEERPWIAKRWDDLRCLTPAVLQQKTRTRRTTPRHEFFEACAKLIEAEAALEDAARPHALRLQLALVEYVREELRRRKEQAHVQSFDDLLHRLDEALDRDLAGRIRAKFGAALIDEFQDTDPVQYSIFRKIYLDPDARAAGGVSFFLIGDPKQAIYSFRGADVFTYMGARADVRGGEFTLDTNRRSDPGLIRAVNALFARAARPFVFEEIPFQPVVAPPEAEDALAGVLRGAAPLEVLIAPGAGLAKGASELDLPPRVAAEISRVLQSGARLRARGEEREIGPGDLAVLCRTNLQAKFVHEALQRLRVPAVLYGDSSVFDTAESLEVERVLRAMAEPGEPGALRAALVTSLVGLDGEGLERLRDDERRWDRIVAEFAMLSEIWRTQGFVAAFRRMLEDHGVEARLLRWIDGERRLTNVFHLAELLQNAAAAEHRGPLALVEWLNRRRHDPSARGELATEAAQIRLESDARRVKVTTIHQAKGLEYAVVYCPFLWTRIWKPAEEGFAFHDSGAGHERRLDIGSAERDEHARLHQREELAESLRLLYVALTRAKHRCSVVWGRFSEGGSSALGYLLHRPTSDGAETNLARLTDALQARIDSHEFEEDLQRLAALAPGAIALRELASGEDVPYVAPGEVDALSPARPAKRVLDDGWRTSSFTRLAAGGGRLSAPAEEGVDHDESEEERAAAERREMPEPPVVLHEFPKGPRSGEFLHEILETLDFGAPLAEVSAAVDAALSGHGFAEAWRDRVTQAIVGVLETPLGGAVGALSLRGLAKERRVSEMEFLFPVAERGARVRLTGARLAAVLRKAGAPRAHPAYAERVERLGFAPLAGFLRGFVDLVFEHGGRWYVVDWKSNFLGPAASQYAPPRIVAAMAHHHYFLQYHLYLVALDRHLRARLSGYEPARHLGGVYYLFLRGMAPHHPAGTGVFHDRPPAALLEELSAVLRGSAIDGDRPR